MKKTVNITIGLLFMALQGSWAGSYEGIYSGTFWGVSGGEFVSIVKEDNSMVIWSYDATWEEGFRNTLTVDPGGEFGGLVGETWITGRIVDDSVSGSGTNAWGDIYFGGNRKPDSGSTNHFVGYYEGVADSNYGTYDCDCIVAADGTAWFYSRGGVYGENGGQGTIDSSGKFHVVDIDGIAYSGTVDERTFNILDGTFSGGSERGTLSFTRLITFAHLPSIAEHNPRIVLRAGGSLQLRMMTHERRSYTVCRSTDLKNWSARETFRGTGSELVYTESPSAGQMFYCVEIGE